MNKNELKKIEREITKKLGDKESYYRSLSAELANLIKSLKNEFKEVFSTLDKRNRVYFEQLDKFIDKLEKSQDWNVGILEGIREAIREIKVEVPKGPEFPKSMKLEGFKFPETTKLEKPKWWKEAKDYNPLITALGRAIVGEIHKQSNRQIKAEIINKFAKEAIPVRLVDKDGRRFYNAVLEAIASGGSSFPFVNPSGSPLEALVDNEKHLQIDTLNTPLISTSPTVSNTTLTLANTEYSYVIPNNTKKYTIQVRANVDIRYAFETGKVATPTAPYMTLKGGQNYWEDSLNLSSKTIYLASATAGTVVEIISWS